VYAERADDQKPSEDRLGRRGRLFDRHRFLDGRPRFLGQLDRGHARVVVGHPASRVHLVVPGGVRITGRDHRIVPALLRHRDLTAAAAVVGGAVAAAAVAVVRVTVAAREPVHQLLDRVHEKEAHTHDELGEQSGQGGFRVERPVVGQPLDALPDLGQQVQKRGA